MTMQLSRLGKCREAVATSPSWLRALGIVINSNHSSLVSKLVISYPFRRVESSKYNAYYSNKFVHLRRRQYILFARVGPVT